MTTLVSGNPGSGKSTLTAELRRRGLAALDADEVHGLAAWRNADGDTVGDASLEPTPELLAECSWGWSGPMLDRVVGRLGPEGVLLGVAVNQWEFLDRFDGLVLLELDAMTQLDRVAARDPLFREQIRVGLPVLQTRMIELGAVRIDATRPTRAVADDLVGVLRARGPRRD